MSNDNNYHGFDKVSLGMQFDMFAKEFKCYSKIMIIKVNQSKKFFKCLTTTVWSKHRLQPFKTKIKLYIHQVPNTKTIHETNKTLLWWTISKESNIFRTFLGSNRDIWILKFAYLCNESERIRFIFCSEILWQGVIET